MGQRQSDVSVMKERFLADCMLGRLAKWLRILGYDTLYEPTQVKGMLKPPECIGDRRFLTRRRGLQKSIPGCICLRSDHIGDQLCQMVRQELIHPDLEKVFGRCSSCNTELVRADPGEARDYVPEYVFFRHSHEFLRCPSCNRHYWQGTHKDRMRSQLEEWGVLVKKREDIELK